MNRDELTPEYFAGYRQGRLPPAKMLAVSDLLAREPDLRNALETVACALAIPPPKGLAEMLHEEDEMPSSTEMVAYLDGKMEAADREAFEMKLAVLPELRADLEDLRAFRARFAAHPADNIIRPRWSRPSIIPWAAAAAVAMAGLTWVALRDQGGNNVASTGGFAVRIPSEAPAEFAAACIQVAEGATLASLLPSELARRPGGSLLGAAIESDAPRARGPLRTFVRLASPEFRWEPMAQAEGYRVVLLREGAADVLESGILSAGAHTWRPRQNLERGVSYTWEVIALAGGREVAKSPRPDEAPATFSVLTLAQLETLRAMEAAAGQDAATRAVAYARAGLREEALEALASVRGVDAARQKAERVALEP